jgi:putative ABC transport system permease protein
MPDWRDSVRARLSSLRLAPAREAEIVEEMSQHLDERYGELLRGGASAEEAARLALREFGEDKLAERMSALRQAHAPTTITPAAATGRRLSDGWQDLRYTTRMALRALRKEFGFTVTTIVILALALAVNVTAFRLLDATLLHGYPFVADNDRMVFIDERFPFPGCCVTYADFDAWRTQAQSFEGLTFGLIKQVALGEGAAEARDVSVNALSTNALQVLGIAPALGRDFRSSDEAPGAASVVMVSHRYWLTRWGVDAAVVGSTVNVNGSPATIVGVLPQGFEFPQRTDIWMPLQPSVDLRTAVANGSFVFGRLAEGATEAAARAELQAINARLAAESPATNRDVSPVVTSFMRSFAGPNASLVYGSLWAGAWLVLAIAIANVANLALARAQSRVRETRTRLALGAGRARVVGQWLVESLLLVAVAALFAWAAVLWSTRFWSAATATQYQVRDYAPNAVTLAYLAVIALVAVAVLALVPASRLWRLEGSGVLKGEAHGATMNLRARRFSAALVAGQMMLAIVLLSGAGVLGHSLWNVLGADLGIETPENVLIGRLDLPAAKYPTPAARTAFFDSLRARLVAVPGVTSAAFANGRPVDDHEPRPVEAEGQSGVVSGAPVFATGPGYFETIGAPLFAGRGFSETDGATKPAVAIVNRSFAETLFPGRAAIGQRIRLATKREPGSGDWRTIVGVVTNVMQNDAFRRSFQPAVYVPFAQEPTNYGWFFVRARYMSDGLAAAVRREVEQLDPSLEILSFMTLEANLGFSLETLGRGGPGSAEYAALSRHAAVAPVFAVVALLLAVAGLYAVVARSVGQRTKEIGVRMALGAAAPAIRRLVLREGMTPVLVGLGLGLAASLAVNRVLQSQLVGVSPYDALTLTLAPTLLLAVALVGCLLPLRQAVHVDPVVALRND